MCVCKLNTHLVQGEAKVDALFSFSFTFGYVTTRGGSHNVVMLVREY